MTPTSGVIPIRLWGSIYENLWTIWLPQSPKATAAVTTTGPVKQQQIPLHILMTIMCGYQQHHQNAPTSSSSGDEKKKGVEPLQLLRGYNLFTPKSKGCLGRGGKGMSGKSEKRWTQNPTVKAKTHREKRRSTYSHWWKIVLVHLSR